MALSFVFLSGFACVMVCLTYLFREMYLHAALTYSAYLVLWGYFIFITPEYLGFIIFTAVAATVICIAILIVMLKSEEVGA